MQCRVMMILTVLLLGACGPVPGGLLAGTRSATPESWHDVMGDTKICEVQSRPAKPHSIQLSCFLFEDKLYVQSHRWVTAPWWPGTSWALIWQEQPLITVRLDQSLYALEAVPVVEPGQRAKILHFRQYNSPPDGIVVFQLRRLSGESGA